MRLQQNILLQRATVSNFRRRKEKASLGIGEPKPCANGGYSFVTKTKVKPGWQVNLIADAKQDEKFLQAQRYVPISVCATAKIGEPLSIKAEYERGGRRIQVEKNPNTISIKPSTRL